MTTLMVCQRTESISVLLLKDTQMQNLRHITRQAEKFVTFTRFLFLEYFIILFEGDTPIRAIFRISRFSKNDHIMLMICWLVVVDIFPLFKRAYIQASNYVLLPARAREKSYAQDECYQLPY